METLEPKHRKALIIGSLVGALLGAGATWLMIAAPANLKDDEEPEAISPGDILNITGAAATLIKMIDNFRHRL